MTPRTRLAPISVLVAALSVLATAGPAYATEGFGIESFETTFTPQAGVAANQAGSHPYAMTVSLTFNHHTDEAPGFLHGETFPNVDVQDIRVTLPAGVVANLQATQKCSESTLEAEATYCPNASAVGVLAYETPEFGGEGSRTPLYDIATPPGAPPELGTNVLNEGVVLHIVGGVQPGGTHALTATVEDLPEKRIAAVFHASVVLWGNPSDPMHNRVRGKCALYDEPQKIKDEEEAEIYRRGGDLKDLEIAEGEFDCRAPTDSAPLLTLPTACTGQPIVSTMSAQSWPIESEPGAPARPATAEMHATSPAITGCGALAFTPAFTIQPETSSAETPTGLTADLQLPHEESLTGLSQAALKKLVAVLPAGMTVSPSAANGLQSCTPEQIGLENANPPACPAASEIAEGEITTPLLEQPLNARVYLAQQEKFEGALVGAYLVAEGSGILIKLGGHASLDPHTGQVTTIFDNNPQDPISSLKLHFFGGAGAPLMTPVECGEYNITTQLTSWAGGTPVSLNSPFTINQGCTHPFAPTLTAGSATATAGAYSPFTLTFARQDGEQRLQGLTQTLPAGELAKLAGVPQCPSAQAAAGECPESSRIGAVTTTAGPGIDPVTVHGTIYLTGPYNGGPYGEAVEVPAIAGPFNLDENGRPVVVRGSIRINPTTAQATVVSDPFPTILRGIPLDVRTVNVTLDRPGFTFNATNCEPGASTATISSTTGGSATDASHYQPSGCAQLPFKPVFTVSTAGRASRANGASLDVKVTAKQGPQPGGGEANIHSVYVELPKQLPSRDSTLKRACRDAIFQANPAGCPKESDVGTATVHTPLLAGPLSGPAYLVSHGGAAFPDLELVLQGEGITFILDGKTNIEHGITSNHFETVPDAPISSFELKLPTGRYSILGAYTKAGNYNLCGQTLNMPTRITGQNGAVITKSTKIAVTGCVKAKTSRARSSRRRATRSGHTTRKRDR